MVAVRQMLIIPDAVTRSRHAQLSAGSVAIPRAFKQAGESREN
jgi:hypothetical protein